MWGLEVGRAIIMLLIPDTTRLVVTFAVDERMIMTQKKPKPQDSPPVFENKKYPFKLAEPQRQMDVLLRVVLKG